MHHQVSLLARWRIIVSRGKDGGDPLFFMPHLPLVFAARLSFDTHFSLLCSINGHIVPQIRFLCEHISLLLPILSVLLAGCALVSLLLLELQELLDLVRVRHFSLGVSPRSINFSIITITEIFE